MPPFIDALQKVVTARLADIAHSTSADPKDLAAAEQLYQLGHREFPPLKSLYRTNLPVPATTFPDVESRSSSTSGPASASHFPSPERFRR